MNVSNRTPQIIGIENIEHASSVIRSLRSKSCSINRTVNNNSTYNSLAGPLDGNPPTSNEQPLIPSLNKFNQMVLQAKEITDERKRIADAIDLSIEKFQTMSTTDANTSPRKLPSMKPNSSSHIDDNDFDFSSDDDDNNIPTSNGMKSPKKASTKSSFPTASKSKKELSATVPNGIHNDPSNLTKSPGKGGKYSDDSWSDGEDGDDFEAKKALFKDFVAPNHNNNKTLRSSTGGMDDEEDHVSHGEKSMDRGNHSAGRKIIQGTKDLLSSSSSNNRMVVKPGQRIFVRATGSKKKNGSS